MDKTELYKLLKENLSIKTNIGWQGSQKVLSVKLLFDSKEICKSEVTLDWDDDDWDEYSNGIMFSFILSVCIL